MDIPSTALDFAPDVELAQALIIWNCPDLTKRRYDTTLCRMFGNISGRFSLENHVHSVLSSSAAVGTPSKWRVKKFREKF